jgi:biopolymer transport protein ExbD
MKKGGLKAVHDLHPNVTPLIDIVMCLIVFYMLVARFAVDTGADTRNITLPLSLQGITLTDMGNTVTLNVLEPPGGGDLPRVTTLDPRTNERIDIAVLDPVTGRRPLADWLRTLRGQNAEFKVIIRADQDLDYRFIEPVLLSSAGNAKNVNFATAKEQPAIAP